MLFRLRHRNKEVRDDSPRYVSSLQKDVGKYLGWTREEVEGDYRARKSVHTIMTIGYMEYSDDVLVLTGKGEMLMQNVTVASQNADQVRE